MGINLSVLEHAADLNVLHRNAFVMDIGSSNLYNADYAGIIGFVLRFCPEFTPEQLIPWAQKLASGSAYDPIKGGLNESWAGELIEKAGMNYTSIDIANGYNTVPFDLNVDSIHPEWMGKFDLVINCGTTEHIFNQANAFYVIHNLTKPNGVMLHEVPLSGHTDHCYFTYTGRFFYELADINDYEILDTQYTKGGQDDLLLSAKNYAKHFDQLMKYVDSDAVPIPNHALKIILKKKYDRQFALCGDTATSVGELMLGSPKSTFIARLKYAIKKLFSAGS